MGIGSNPPDRIEVDSVPVARLDRVPLAGSVLEPPPPFRDVGAVLGVPSPVFSLDEVETLPEVRQKDSA